MRINNIGGEFALIERVTRRIDDPRVVVGIGDDTAVLEYTDKEYLLYTTDMLVEGDHFKTGWSTPRQIGVKAMESNVSDIAAMGGTPTHALVSLALPPETSVEFVDGLYEGLYSVSDKYGFNIVGGDTTHGSVTVINVALLGVVEKDRLCLRSNATVGDLICVTGDLGKSKAGLEMLSRGFKGDFKHHLEPACRLHEARSISAHAHAMIDVSDGLASEVNHICGMSGVGAIVFRDRIPVSEKTREYAGKCGGDPVEYALDGGEDYELVFTVAEESLKKIKLDVQVTVVGRIVEEKEGVLLSDGDSKTELKGGFNHFNHH
jgi:thiamine-monophosphate kinase